MPGPTPNQTRLRITGYLPYDVPDTSGGTGGGTVATVAALAALPTLGLVDNQLVWVEGRRRYFRWDAQSNATALDGEIVVPTGAPLQGRWISVPWTTSIENALQAAWTIDPIGGSDDNAAGPLATFMEYTRRVPVLYVSQVVTIASTLPDTDNLSYEPMVQWRQSLSATFPTLAINGVRTLGANAAVVTSTNETGNAAPTLDVGAALTVGSIVQATSGAVAGASAVIVALIAGTNYRTSPWSSATLVRVAPPAAADTVAVVTLPTVNNFAITGSGLGRLGVTNLNIKVLRGMGSSAGSATIDFSSFGGTQDVIPPAGTLWLFRACSFTTTGLIFTINVGAALQMRLCGVIRAGDTINCNGFSRAEFRDTVLQGCNLRLGVDGFAGSIASVLINSLGIFGVAADVSLSVRRGSIASIEGTLYGPDPGGASTGTSVVQGGSIKVKSSVTPTLTGATELSFDGAATASAAPPLATGIIPPAVALTTWAQWAAAPFSRDVMSYRTAGTGINNYV